jgi:hypothetical protein
MSLGVIMAFSVCLMLVLFRFRKKKTEATKDPIWVNLGVSVLVVILVYAFDVHTILLLNTWMLKETRSPPEEMLPLLMVMFLGIKDAYKSGLNFSDPLYKATIELLMLVILHTLNTVVLVSFPWPKMTNLPSSTWIPVAPWLVVILLPSSIGLSFIIGIYRKRLKDKNMHVIAEA